MASIASGTSPKKRDMARIAREITSRLEERGTGREYNHNEVHAGNAPNDRYFVGNLSPGDEDLDPDDNDIFSRVSPSALQMIIQVEIEGDSGTLQIAPDFSIFYRIFPPWDTDKPEPVVGHYRKARVSPEIDEELSPVEITIPLLDNEADIQTALDDEADKLTAEISAATDRVYEGILDDPLHYRDTDAGEDIVSDFEEDNFEDGAAYLRAIQGLSAGRECRPELQPEINLAVLDMDDGAVELKISLENRSPTPNSDDEDIDYGDRIDTDVTDSTFFDSQVRIEEGTATLTPFNFHQLDEDYRFDRSLEGYGINCTVASDEGSDTIYRSSCLPTHTQHRYKHKRPDDPDARPHFRQLAEDPIPVLRAIKTEMEIYRDNEWDDRLDELREEGSEDIDSAKSYAKDFEAEIKSLERGITALENHPRALRAFKLMNETFDEKVKKGDGDNPEREYPGWRLFQIVYIVSNIPDILSRDPDCDIPEDEHSRDDVSLIWFPTGGGKTEAYLGLLVMNMLFDRMREKNLGLTSMMRFPLRLLSLQQFQRITEIFMYADETREKHDLGGDEFSVGYLTGGTPNKMRDVIKNEQNRSGLNSYNTSENTNYVDQLKKDWENGSLESVQPSDFQVIEECPNCGGDVSMEVNADDILFDHICNGPCEWDRLPIYVVDNEIYRKLPTMVIGTQDKLAALGYERKFRLLLGKVNGVCPKHGYTDGTECTEKYFCDIPDDSHLSITPKDPVPGLQIQDELHLIKEDLGTFESHYWAAMQKIIEWGDYPSSKVIAATATIEEFENQIQHIYQKKGSLFPAPGPKYRESFYASEDEEELQRLFVGVMPWNRSHINTVVTAIETQQKVIQDLRDDPEDHLDLSDFESITTSDELDELLRYYAAAINYVITRKEGDRIHKSVDTQINEDLKREGYNEIDRLRLTSGSDFATISRILDSFQRLADDPAAIEDIKELVIATSSISHGVDLETLNYMIFFGMPRRTAEYIQSSSRVGREYPGIIVDVFHPIRERDRSHYHYFNKYHQYLDRLVEPVPVNRWAKFSIDRTLPGIFMALILQHYYSDIHTSAGSPYLTENVKSAISKGLLSKESIKGNLQEIYGRDRRDRDVFGNKINSTIDTYMTAIANDQAKFTSDSMGGDDRAMFSLRDVDEPVNIFADRDEGRIVDNLRGHNGGDS